MKSNGTFSNSIFLLISVSLKEVAKLTESLKEEKSKSGDTLADLQKDKEKYMQLSRDRGQLVEDKVAEIKRLSDRLHAVEKELISAKDRFESEALRIDKDLLVQDLKRRTSEAEEKLTQYKREYSAFVCERNQRLTKEIELNKHLKQLLNA